MLVKLIGGYSDGCALSGKGSVVCCYQDRVRYQPGQGSSVLPCRGSDVVMSLPINKLQIFCHTLVTKVTSSIPGTAIILTANSNLSSTEVENSVCRLKLGKKSKSTSGIEPVTTVSIICRNPVCCKTFFSFYLLNQFSLKTLTVRLLWVP